MRGRPLSLIAAGLVFVALDFRIVHVDLLPDPVGWFLVALAAHRWAQRTPLLLAGFATVATLPDVLLTYHYDDLDPLTGEVVVNGGGTGYDQRLAFDRITDVRGLLAVLALAAGGLALFLLLTMLEDRADLLGDRPASSQLWFARVLLVAGWIVPHVGVMAFQWLSGDGLDPVWNGGLELVAQPGLVVAALLVVGAVINRNRGWTATDDDGPTPWAQLWAERGTRPAL